MGWASSILHNLIRNINEITLKSLAIFRVHEGITKANCITLPRPMIMWCCRSVVPNQGGE